MYARHTTMLQFAEIRRGLQALSTTYVQRRDRLPSGAVFSGAGKRAAFALFYTPLHFLTVRAVVEALQPPDPQHLWDLGCGTGAGAAAWARAAKRAPRITGIDVNPWALAEARWNWRSLDVHTGCQTLQQDAAHLRITGPAPSILAAYTVNELPDTARQTLLSALTARLTQGAQLLIIEPIATRLTPWWPAWEAALQRFAPRMDTWRFRAPPLPEKLRLLDKAAGLNHRELTARSLYVSTL